MAYDMYMNFQVYITMEYTATINTQLGGTSEFVDGKLTGPIGEVLIRCNNVLYIRSADGISE